jgi:hypothetical protein
MAYDLQFVPGVDDVEGNRLFREEMIRVCTEGGWNVDESMSTKELRQILSCVRNGKVQPEEKPQETAYQRSKKR